jgi:hypothetical protein
MTSNTQMHHIGKNMEQCIQNCQDCHKICLSTLFSYCMEQGGQHARPEHIRLLLDCAEICQTSADFMLRGSDFHVRTCGICAEVCARCATECGLFENDARMQDCAEVCRRCAEFCRQMAMTTV